MRLKMNRMECMPPLEITDYNWKIYSNENKSNNRLALFNFPEFIFTTVA
jgi:hypothetical protein